jgi:DNA-binding response OmpR family regulator
VRAVDGRRRILVIEDGPEISEVVRTVLEEEGYRVMARKRGRSGLRAATTFRPDVVGLDLFLPDLPGVEVLRELRSAHDTRDTAVIVITGQYGRIADARVAGADLVIEKPFDIDELLAAVHSVANRRPSQRHEAAAVPPPLVHAHTPPRPRPGHHVAGWRARRRNA